MRLKRVLTASDAAWLVAGSMVGSGIFITPGLVAGHLPGVVWPLTAWLVGGLVSVCGALVYGELGARIPEAGGDYRYLAEAYGPLAGFVHGWAAITLTFSAAAAAQCRAAITYLLAAVPSFDPPAWAVTVAAPAVVLLLTWANTVGARVAGRTTVLLTAAPLAVLFGVFVWGATRTVEPIRLPEPWLVSPASPWPVALSVALVPVFFTYSGWNAAAYLAGEMREPGRGLARGLVIGTGSVTLLYILVNVALLAILPQSALAGASSPAADAARRLLGGTGESLLAVTIAVAILGSANVTIMAGARVYYAMATDGLAPSALGRVNAAGVPVAALVLGGVWSAGLALVGQVETLVGWATLAILLLSSLTVTGLFVIRRRGGEPAFRCPGYPVTPVVYLVVSLGAAYASYRYDRSHALIGLAIIALGIPLYYVIRNRFKPERV